MSDAALMERAAAGVVRRLQEAGHAAYFAGGCVRDRLLGRAPHDFDVATDAVPDQVIALFPRTTGLIGKSFGVVGVMTEAGAIEVATFRQDLEYRDGRRPEGVRFVTAQEDAQRRDFTVNGLFYDPVAGKVIDFVGGQADLERKVLRAIGDPAARFREDRLRLLRAVRFATTLGFAIDPATWEAVRAAAPAVAAEGGVSPERIREELDKIWTGPDPARGLDLLDQSGLLQAVLPEVVALHGVEQPPQFHPEGDVYKHTRLMLSKLPPQPSRVLALSVLFHDIGKPATFQVDPTGRIRFNGHETVGARMTEEILGRLRYSNEVIGQVVACVENHMSFKDAPQMRLSTLKRFLARPTFPEELELHRIDCSSSHGLLDIYEFLKEKLATMPPEEVDPEPLLTGHDVMAELGLKPGKELGALLKQLREAQLEGAVADREGALAFLRGLRQ
ncbi:MAG: CCA tRNA nucleotidyltransferase [Verrucomicrobium sp.]|nr:CCA tRNA nucleotidyltransferase [Verrucomicrobium sp.]